MHTVKSLLPCMISVICCGASLPLHTHAACRLWVQDKKVADDDAWARMPSSMDHIDWSMPKATGVQHSNRHCCILKLADLESLGYMSPMAMRLWINHCIPS